MFIDVAKIHLKAGKGGNGVSSITFGATVTEVGDNAFFEYCYPALKNAYFVNDANTYTYDEAQMGFTSNGVNVEFEYNEAMGDMGG